MMHNKVDAPALDLQLNKDIIHKYEDMTVYEINQEIKNSNKEAIRYLEGTAKLL